MPPQRTPLALLIATALVALAAAPASAKWAQVKGPVLTATLQWEGLPEQRPIVQEPTVIWDQDRYRLWYTGGWETTALGYAESRDGIHWAKRTVQVMDDAQHANVVKTSTGFHIYAASSDGRLDVAYVRPDGVTVYGRRTVMRPAAGSFTARGIANTFAWRSRTGVWQLMYEGFGIDRVWRTGLADNGGPGWGWNPGRTIHHIGIGGMYGGPWLDQGCLYFHAAKTGNLPTRIYRRCGGLNRLGRAELMLDMEQPSWQVDQVADPSIARRPGHPALMMFDGIDNEASAGAIGAAWERP